MILKLLPILFLASACVITVSEPIASKSSTPIVSASPSSTPLVADVAVKTGNESWSSLENQVFVATNLARTNPAKFSEMYIEPILANGSSNFIPEREKQDYLEAIDFMKKQKPLPALTASDELRVASTYHVNDIGQKDLAQHNSSDGSTFSQRFEKFGTPVGSVAENISFGSLSGSDVLVGFIVDVGIKARGHRKNIFAEDFKVMGIACGEHKTYKIMCVQDFAEGYSKK